MNWRVSWLDDYTLISSSDAHSPPKLAREATCFDTELSYDALFDALRGGGRNGYRGTIEFFPEEGKYHMDGHRKCGVCWEPATTRAHGGRCSACGKPVTVGRVPPHGGTGRPPARCAPRLRRTVRQPDPAAGGAVRDARRRPQFQARAARVPPAGGAARTGAGHSARGAAGGDRWRRRRGAGRGHPPHARRRGARPGRLRRRVRRDPPVRRRGGPLVGGATRHVRRATRDRRSARSVRRPAACRPARRTCAGVRRRGNGSGARRDACSGPRRAGHAAPGRRIAVRA